MTVDEIPGNNQYEMKKPKILYFRSEMAILCSRADDRADDACTCCMMLTRSLFLYY